LLVAAVPAWIGALAVFVGLEAVPLLLLALSDPCCSTSTASRVNWDEASLAGALLLACCAQALAVRRVVSLAPSLSEMVVELGAADLLVGVLDGGERPAALAQVASVGRYGQLDMERLLSLNPDLILLWPGSVGPAQREQLQLNIPVYVAEPHSLNSSPPRRPSPSNGACRCRPAIGRAVAAPGRPAPAYRREPLRVFYQVWNQPLYTVGGGQIISDALRYAVHAMCSTT
jgi:vitamin B12 transport system substrate-binding protein